MNDPPSHACPCGHLLRLLRRPASATELELPHWDRVVRLARQVRLLGVLHQRIAAAGALEAVPEAPLGHLRAAAHLARHRSQMMRMELTALARALGPLAGRAVLLKGAAYLAADLPLATGRLPGDVDLLMAHDDLAAAERALLDAGWEPQVSDDYDQRYYRQWSHELPPLRYPGHALEVDLHHTITPGIGRLRPNPQSLLDSAQRLPGSPWRVLSPADQVLHVAVHLFQDSELTLELHQLADFDSLLRHHAAEQSFWPTLLRHAALHGIARPLWYALRYARSLLETPAPDLDIEVPAFSRWAMDWLVPRALLPTDPADDPPFDTRPARGLLRARYHWLRMPPGILLPHLGRKLLRRVVGRVGTPKSR